MMQILSNPQVAQGFDRVVFDMPINKNYVYISFCFGGFLRIHVTKTLADKLKRKDCEISDTADTRSSVLGVWHANFTAITRRQCLVFTQDQT